MGSIIAGCFVCGLSEYSVFFDILFLPLIIIFVWSMAYVGTKSSHISYILYSVPDETVGGLDHE